MHYSKQVLRHFDRPARSGVLADGISATAGSVARGIQVELHLRAGQGHIEDAAFRAFGCPHVIAAASWLADRLPGLSCAEAALIDAAALARELGAPPEKLGALLIVEDALRAVLAQAEGPLNED